jgi:hypothetical protein
LAQPLANTNQNSKSKIHIENIIQNLIKKSKVMEFNLEHLETQFHLSMTHLLVSMVNL